MPTIKVSMSEENRNRVNAFCGKNYLAKSEWITAVLMNTLDEMELEEKLGAKSYNLECVKHFQDMVQEL